MIDLQSTSLVPHWARRDPIRNEPTVRGRAKLRVNYAVGDTVLQPKKADADGWCVFECYQSEFERMKNDVETNLAGIEAAKKANARRFRSVVTQKHNRLDVGEDVSTWPEEMQKEAARWTGSTEAEFYHANLRGILPIIGLELLETLPPPQTTEQSAIAQAVEAAVKAALEAAGVQPGKKK